MSKGKDFTRRDFLKGTGVTAGAVIAGSSLLAVGATEALAQHNEFAAGSSEDRIFRGTMFFTDRADFETLSEAAERIFPKDELGPGAIDLAVPYFIDNQLAGAYGFNDREYMQGPFFPGKPEQGYQTPMNKREIFRAGVKALDSEAKARYKKIFVDISNAQKDEVLRAFEAGSAKMEGISSSYFFGLLKSAVLAGVYADPIYNGNNNMNGWIMKEYPGAQMSYKSIIMDKKFKKIPPMSLADMQ